jgi:hypothetical protein
LVRKPGDGTDVRYKDLNATTVTPEDFYLENGQKLVEGLPVYWSFFHPFNGPLAIFGLMNIKGYLGLIFSRVPPVGVAVILSFIMRQYMQVSLFNQCEI